ncbi:MAG: ComEC/Rec2 family competence protein, partial [Planctomycetota bacterium]
VPAILALGSLLAFSTRKRTVFLGTVLCAMLAWLVPWPEKPGRSFRLLRVGHGQSALFLEPGRSLAFDCGDSVGGGRAARRLCEALRQAGRSRLDHLILSHGDHDHASGLPELCLRVAIGRVWLPESPKCGAWVRLLRRHGIPFRVIPPGSELSPLDGCRILYPHEEGDLAGSNDGALVLHYRFPDGPRILVTGDQEDAGILACVSRLRRMRDPGSDIVVLPHHGRSRRFLGELLEITRPEFCLASTSLTGGLAGVPRGRLLTTATAGDLVLEQARDGRYYLEGKARVGR